MSSVEDSTEGGRRCPSCAKQMLVPREIVDEFEYGRDDERIKIVANAVQVLVCQNPDCGETLYGPEAARVRHQAISSTLKLLTPAQITALRERLGKTQAEFAELTAIGVETLSRWERGRLLQTRAFDNYLRVLDALPEAVGVLEEIGNRQLALNGQAKALHPIASP